MDLPSEEEKPIALDVEAINDIQIESHEELDIQSHEEMDFQSHEEMDLTDTFTTDMVFDTRLELIKWVRQVGRTVGTVIVIKNSDSPDSGRTPRIVLGCERGGKYRKAKKGSEKNTRTRRSSSKRCGCPFALKGIKLPEGDQWKVKVECGFHNHPMVKGFGGHSFAGKLNEDEKVILAEMSKNGVKPRDILHILQEKDNTNASTIKNIYNARSKMRVSKMARRSQIQHLMKTTTDELYHRSEFQMFVRRFEEAPEDQKIEMLKKLKELADPSSTSLLEPEETKSPILVDPGVLVENPELEIKEIDPYHEPDV